MRKIALAMRTVAASWNPQKTGELFLAIEDGGVCGIAVSAAKTPYSGAAAPTVPNALVYLTGPKAFTTRPIGSSIKGCGVAGETAPSLHIAPEASGCAGWKPGLLVLSHSDSSPFVVAESIDGAYHWLRLSDWALVAPQPDTFFRTEAWELRFGGDEGILVSAARTMTEEAVPA